MTDGDGGGRGEPAICTAAAALADIAGDGGEFGHI